jgi:ribosomal protein L32E
MRRRKTPAFLRAKSQLKRAVRAPPTWRYPVGLGAKRTRTVMEEGF